MNLEWLGGPDDGKVVSVQGHPSVYRVAVMQPFTMADPWSMYPTDSMETRTLNIIRWAGWEIDDEGVGRVEKWFIDYYGFMGR